MKTKKVPTTGLTLFEAQAQVVPPESDTVWVTNTGLKTKLSRQVLFVFGSSDRRIFSDVRLIYKHACF